MKKRPERVAETGRGPVGGFASAPGPQAGPEGRKATQKFEWRNLNIAFMQFHQI
jgi:hypothetical protein